MPTGPMYTVLDETSHVIDIEEHTFCGLEIPHGNGWVSERPAKVCAECAEKALGETPTGKPKDTDEEPAFAPVEGQYEAELDKPDHVAGEYADDPTVKPKAKAKSGDK